jgi:hypothetical protein
MQAMPRSKPKSGKIGEYLHSDLAVVNLPDSNVFKYVLTIVEEILDEVIVTLLKDKTAATTLEACKKSHKIITARSKSQLKAWQFDRGSEFFNAKFEEWHEIFQRLLDEKWGLDFVKHGFS